MINMMFPKGSKRRRFVKDLLFEPKVPPHLACNFISLKESELMSIKTSLEQNFFSREPDGYLSTDVGRKDLIDHLTTRLEGDRRFTIPWLDNVRHLEDARVLEIGCGTGASTVALAEQGARVTAIDIDDGALVVAKARCDICRCDVDFRQMNATEVAGAFSGESFDFIIFWACLEHMTHEERMIAMKETWNMLPPGGLWCITETPNRLYCYDSHTSLLPFYLWLPDDLAIKYAQFSPRRKFRESLLGYRQHDLMLDFSRWGRGLSFHELELTIKPLEQMKIVSSMSAYNSRRDILSFLRSRVSFSHRYESFFHRLYPVIHRGFLQPYLDLILQKD